MVEASPEDVFDYVADYKHVRQVLDGVTRWQPIGPSQGVGARFDVEISAAGLPLTGVLVLDTWKRPSEIGWVSESGIVRQRGGWRLRPVDGGATEVELRISYVPPGAALGNLLAGRVDGLVRRRLKRALERVAEQVEAGRAE